MGVVAGEIRMCGFSFAPQGWLACQGQTLNSSDYPELYKAVGIAFGGDSSGNFQLPDLQDRAPVHIGQGADGMTYALGDAGGTDNVTLTTSQIPAHGHPLPASTATGVSASPQGSAFAASQAQQYTPLGSDLGGAWLKPWGGSQAHENRMPYLTLNYIIATTSAASETQSNDAKQQPELQVGVPGQLGYFATGMVPNGWVPCNGQAANVPDLQGRFALGAGEGYPLGQSAGETTHVLRLNELPTHYHSVAACGAESDTGNPVGNFPALYDGPRGPLYNAHADTSLPFSSLAGAGEAHENRPPFLALNVCCDPSGTVQGESYLGEIRCAYGAWHDKSWLPCDGRPIPIAQAPALFALLNNFYGGDRTHFLLPNLSGSVVCGLPGDDDPGESGGAATVTLSSNEIPAHGHSGSVSTESNQRQDAPAPDTFPTMVAGRGGALTLYATPQLESQQEVLMLPSQIAGGGEPHNNMAPYTALNFYICVNGLYPPKPS